MELFQKIYKTNSNRLENFDYRSIGDYFITICTKDRKEFFGKIYNDYMCINPEGTIIYCISEMVHKKFPNAKINEIIVMPNHIHLIVCIHSRRYVINHVSTGKQQGTKQLGGITTIHNPMGKNSIGEIIRWFKGRATFEIRKINSDFEWQTNYYDSIINGKNAYERIQRYIIENPMNW